MISSVFRSTPREFISTERVDSCCETTQVRAGTLPGESQETFCKISQSLQGWPLGYVSARRARVEQAVPLALACKHAPQHRCINRTAASIFFQRALLNEYFPARDPLVPPLISDSFFFCRVVCHYVHTVRVFLKGFYRRRQFAFVPELSVSTGWVQMFTLNYIDFEVISLPSQYEIRESRFSRVYRDFPASSVLD